MSTKRKPKMEIFKLLCTWSMVATVNVAAETEDKAIDYAMGEMPLPDGEYVSDSFVAEPTEGMR
jgi:hypothetical protein